MSIWRRGDKVAERRQLPSLIQARAYPASPARRLAPDPCARTTQGDRTAEELLRIQTTGSSAVRPEEERPSVLRDSRPLRLLCWSWRPLRLLCWNLWQLCAVLFEETSFYCGTNFSSCLRATLNTLHCHIRFRSKISSLFFSRVAQNFEITPSLAAVLRRMSKSGVESSAALRVAISPTMPSAAPVQLFANAGETWPDFFVQSDYFLLTFILY